jgi:two-component system phosphate regulon sensor histidine kinase PhoR
MSIQRQAERDATLARGLIAALPDPVIIVRGARVSEANLPARNLFPKMRLGDLLAFVIRSPDVLDATHRVQETGIAKTVSWRERVPLERIFEVRAAPFELPNEERSVVLTLRDLTEAHRVERMRVDFVANASHELRTPLASLLGFIETLQGAARDDQKARERFLTIMREQGRRMARLVEDLLSLSRIEQNQHVQPEAPVDLTALIGHVVDTLAPMASENGVTIAFDTPEAVIVHGDRDELVRVAENLIENAIKYGAAEAAEGKPVEVSVTVDRRRALLRVRDHGPGIAPEHLPRLTERFYRVDAGKSRAKGGTGLGLAIVKHIVARHRGRLDIESTLGEGATFSVSLPLYTKS